MNAAEHIVEAYFQIVKNCFTRVDVKVINGNNRQLDLLAINIKDNKQYHIEVGVTHRENWCSNVQELFGGFEKKFFGLPPMRQGKNTDSSRGKSYFPQILDTYKEAGIDHDKIHRIWVCWIIKNPNQKEELLKTFSDEKKIKIPIQILSLRDDVIPQLEDKIGTSNYDDEVLRTLSFLKQRNLQINER